MLSVVDVVGNVVVVFDNIVDFVGFVLEILVG